MKIQLSILLVFAYCLLIAISGCSQANSGSIQNKNSYSYYYKGSPVNLSASKSLIAVQENVPNFSSVMSKSRLTRDPISERYELKTHSLGLYRASATGAKKGSAVDLGAIAADLSATAGMVIQPVFEKGESILIPFDEVIVGFKDAIPVSEARSYIAEHGKDVGMLELRPHRDKTFILKINNPANGRAFEAAKSLADLEKISFAEPNFVVIRVEDQRSESLLLKSAAGENFIVGYRGEGKAGLQVGAETAPDWTAIASLDFESDVLPPGWQIGFLEGSANVYWGTTAFRQHGGSKSFYCAASGTQAVSPPGPVPINMTGVLRSPLVNLSQYEEVYVELWFYTKNDVDTLNGITFDYPSVLVVDNDNGNFVGQKLAFFSGTGDSTLDPTTSNGWRKLLFRVPPTLHAANAFFDFRYHSDQTIQTEGSYIDDIRIIATTDVDTQLLSNDPFSARQYELRNVGQIAGLANNRSDLHIPEAWELVTVSPDIIVAVIDSGVELTHPDLNLVTGYDPDGTVGGGARGDIRSSHGTNCAGNVGAVKDNGIGVVGTAPGVKIMPVYRGATVADNAGAIDTAVLHGAKILSNSWGGGAPSADIENAVKAALAAGRIVLFAAGNGPDRFPFTYDVVFPGDLTATTDVISVGASSPTDEHKSASSSDGEYSWGSSFVGPGPDVCAPGVWSYTTDLLGKEGNNDGSEINLTDATSADYTSRFNGTSSAAPKVAGVVALMLSKNPNLTPAQVKSILTSTADDIDVPGVDDKTGAGRVNAFKAVQAVPLPEG